MSGSSPVSHIEPSDARHQQLPHGIYQLIDIATGSALDLSGADSTTLIAWSPHDGHNQLWDVAPSSRGEDGGLYLIRSVSTGLFMMGGRRSGGEGSVAWTSCPVARWRVEVEGDDAPDGEIRVRLVHAASGETLQFNNSREAKLVHEDSQTPTWSLVRKGDSQIQSSIVAEQETEPQGHTNDDATPFDNVPLATGRMISRKHATIGLGSFVLVTFSQEVEELQGYEAKAQLNDPYDLWLLTRTTLTIGSLVVFESTVHELNRRKRA